jgi:hypothetical protein
MKYFLTLLLSLFFLTSFAEQPSFMSLGPKEGLWEALEYYNIHNKEIVYAQAVLETGHFKYTNNNNLFGIKSGKHYRKFKHWSDSVEAYKNLIQSRHKPGENYYHFLERIRYAEAKAYTRLLRQIAK